MDSEIVIIAGVVGTMIALVAYLALLIFKQAKGRYQQSFESTASSSLTEMFLFVDTRQLFTINFTMMVVVPLLIYVVTGNIFLPAIAAITIFMAPKMVIKFLQKKRMSDFERQLPDALMMLSGSMRAGASFSLALDSVVTNGEKPLAQEFELLLRQVRMGVDFDTALISAAERMPTPDFQLVVSAIRISREVGGNLGEMLDTLSSTVRQKQAMEGKITGLTAQGKMQGIVMGMLPLLLILVLLVIEPKGMTPLYTTPIGYATMAVIATMMGLGYLFISKITNIDV